MSERRGTVHGFHFQIRNHKANCSGLERFDFDVALDIGEDHLRSGGGVVTLTAGSDEQLFTPRGFAHAFALEPRTEVAYKVDAYYSAQCEADHLEDPALAIEPILSDEAILSEKDAQLPRLIGIASPFVYGETD
jgi:dTDP-4-dehydrorhamnose 3,5-epimerase